MTILTRRTFGASFLAAAALTFAGCGQAKRREGSNDGPARTPQRATMAAAMTVYRNPGCGCCEAWAGLARKAGYKVEVIDAPNIAAIKRKYGVPAQLESCHTAIVGGYAVEGHVPLEDVERLLREKPAGIKGLGVPGMPIGSPGMETPDGTKAPFKVMAFDAKGRVRAFA
jgi:hypothetical protein